MFPCDWIELLLSWQRCRLVRQHVSFHIVQKCGRWRIEDQQGGFTCGGGGGGGVEAVVVAGRHSTEEVRRFQASQGTRACVRDRQKLPLVSRSFSLSSFRLSSAPPRCLVWLPSDREPRAPRPGCRHGAPPTGPSMALAGLFLWHQQQGTSSFYSQTWRVLVLQQAYTHVRDLSCVTYTVSWTVFCWLRPGCCQCYYLVYYMSNPGERYFPHRISFLFPLFLLFSSLFSYLRRQERCCGGVKVFCILTVLEL